MAAHPVTGAFSGEEKKNQGPPAKNTRIQKAKRTAADLENEFRKKEGQKNGTKEGADQNGGAANDANPGTHDLLTRSPKCIENTTMANEGPPPKYLAVDGSLNSILYDYDYDDNPGKINLQDVMEELGPGPHDDSLYQALSLEMEFEEIYNFLNRPSSRDVHSHSSGSLLGY